MTAIDPNESSDLTEDPFAPLGTEVDADVGTTLVPRVPEAQNAIMQLLQIAVERGVPVEHLEKLQALYERMADRAAASEFSAALAAFQQECPPIAKTRTAKIVSQRTGGSYEYRYAELDEIARTVRPLLHRRGLSYSWDSETTDGVLRCICTLRHVNGHGERATFAIPVESPSAMSQQQKHAAALTYARRQSLIQVLGLTTTDPDTDGADGSGAAAEKMNEDQATEIEDLIRETGADKARFLKWLGAASVTEIPARDYARAVAGLNRRAKA